MTKGEAIVELIDIYHNALEFADERTAEAFRIATDAIEKQIPKRVQGRNGEFTKEDYRGIRYTYYSCPNCKKAVKHHTEYCDKCGQHLLFPFVSHTPYIEGEKQEVILTWEDEMYD